MVDTHSLPSQPNLDNGPQMGLTRDVWDLDHDQLLEVLEAIQMETARRRGSTPHGSAQGNLRVPGGDSEADMDDREVGLRGWRGWRYSEPLQQPTNLPWADVDVSHLLNMLAAGLSMGTPRINTFTGYATPGKTKVSFELWYHEVQCIKDHYPEVVDMAKYMAPLLVLPISCANYQLFLAHWPSLMFSCRTSIRSARGIMRRSPPLP